MKRNATASSIIWTLDAESITYDDYYYNKLVSWESIFRFFSNIRCECLPALKIWILERINRWCQLTICSQETWHWLFPDFVFCHKSDFELPSSFLTYNSSSAADPCFVLKLICEVSAAISLSRVPKYHACYELFAWFYRTKDWCSYTTQWNHWGLLVRKILPRK